MNDRKVFDHILGRHYTNFDGLAGMHVEDIYQDRRGLLWIATADGGVGRFDGANFDIFSLSRGVPHITVMTIAEAPDGRMLFGTLGGGLAVYDGQGFQVHTTEHGLPSNEIMSLQPQADGSMRMLTGAGIGRFVDGQCVECVTEIAGQPLGPVYDMATDAAGTTWLATRERGVLSLEGQPLSGDLGTGSGAMQWPWKFAQGPSGPLWIAFRYTGRKPIIGCYDPASNQLELVEVDDPAEEAEIVWHGTRHVRVDDRGLLWMTCRGVLVYDGRAWHPFATELPDSHFSATRLTYEDREGNIWLGLWGGGLVFCDPVSVQLYTQADGLPDSEVQCLSEDREGRLWIGTMGGLACRQDDRIRPVDPRREVSTLVIDQQGQVWSAGPEGDIFKATGGEAAAIEGAETTLAEGIAGLWEDQAGRLNVCTSEGRLGRIEQGRFTPLAERFPRGCTVVLQDGAGTLWVGLSKKESALCYYEDGRFHTPTVAGVKDIGSVSALCEHQGALWIGTENYGLFALDYASEEVRRFTVDQGGLSVNGISALMSDPQGDLWIGTSGGGVLKYDGRTFHTIRLGQGALENIVEAIVRDSRGRLWFGTRRGLIAYRPGETPPRILIRQVVAGRTWDDPQAVSCPDSTPEIQFHFQGISFRSGAGQMRYSHRLVGPGRAEEWSAFTPANKATYRDVPAGQFHFEVRTTDRDGLLSDVARLEVRVTPSPQRHIEHMLRASHQGFISQSPAMAEVLERVDSMAEADLPVLVLGETGVGKGVLARLIHDLSPRRAKPFIAVNSGGLSTGVIHSELFGHEKGAFTDAHIQRIGYFERADGGTLFLDEIGDLSVESQQLLLHVLEDKHLMRLGGGKPTPIDVRIVAATNKDLEEAIQAGVFRDDLLYRLRTLSVLVPPLRERREDIPLLAAYFANQCAQSLKRPVPTLSDEVLAHLQEYPWPGNVRELAHLIQQAVVLGKGDVMRIEDVPLMAAPPIEQGSDEGTDDDAKKWGFFDEDARNEAEKQRILKALQTTNWRVSGPRGAAQLLEISPEKLRYRMRKYGLKRPRKSSQ